MYYNKIKKTQHSHRESVCVSVGACICMHGCVGDKSCVWRRGVERHIGKDGHTLVHVEREGIGSG